MSMLETLLDPERRRKAKEDQDELREKHGGRVVKDDPAIATFYWGQQREQSALAMLDHDSTHGWVLKQLAEGLAAQARYAEAADVTSDPALKTGYEQRAAALDAAGTRICDCPSIQLLPDPNDAKGRAFDNPRDIERVFDGERIITITRCSFCKTISAR